MLLLHEKHERDTNFAEAVGVLLESKLLFSGLSQLLLSLVQFALQLTDELITFCLSHVLSHAKLICMPLLQLPNFLLFSCLEENRKAPICILDTPDFRLRSAAVTRAHIL